MTRLVRAGRAAAALACLGGLAVLGTTTAAAAPPDGAIELSADGQTWSTDLAVDLFDPAFLWVPGDTQTGSLLMRSRACPAATGEAEVTLGPEDAVLVDAFDVRTRVDDGEWTPGTTSAGFTVGAEPSRLDIEVTFDPASGNETQDRTVAPVTVTVTVACPEAAPATSAPAAQPPATRGPGWLPRTGIELARTLTAGVLLVVAGSWLVLATRRRRSADA